MNSHRVFGLDLIRAVAILSVIFLHSRSILIIPLHETRFLNYFGVLGVEAFFVLSGYLIGTILVRTVEDDLRVSALLRFWIRRWFRTLPTYLLVLTSLLLLFGSELMTGEFWRYLVFIQNFKWQHPIFFGVAWSLAVEEWFYLCFPAGLFVSLWIVKFMTKRSVVLLYTLAWILFFTLIRFYVVWVDNPEWYTGVAHVVLLRLDSIGYGVLYAYVAYYYSDWLTNKKFLSWNNVLGMLLFSVISYFLLFDVIPGIKSFFTKTSWFSLTSLSIVLMMPWLSSIEMRDGWLKRSIVEISLLSYSLYLIHDSLIKDLLLRYFEIRTWWDSLIIVEVYFLLSYVIAKYVHIFFEKPMTNLRKCFTPEGSYARFKE